MAREPPQDTRCGRDGAAGQQGPLRDGAKRAGAGPLPWERADALMHASHRAVQQVVTSLDMLSHSLLASLSLSCPPVAMWQSPLSRSGSLRLSR